MSDRVKCIWNHRGGRLEYGGVDYSERFGDLPKDVAMALQGIYGPDFLILWVDDSHVEGFHHHTVENPLVGHFLPSEEVVEEKPTRRKSANQKAAKAKE